MLKREETKGEKETEMNDPTIQEPQILTFLAPDTSAEHHPMSQIIHHTRVLVEILHPS
jgi:hypothetical protein